MEAKVTKGQDRMEVRWTKGRDPRDRIKGRDTNLGQGWKGTRR